MQELIIDHSRLRYVYKRNTEPNFKMLAGCAVFSQYKGKNLALTLKNSQTRSLHERKTEKQQQQQLTDENFPIILISGRSPLHKNDAKSVE